MLSKLEIARETNDGILEPISYMDIFLGDFVEVIASPDIVQRGGRTDVWFSIHKIRKLHDDGKREVRARL